MAGRHKAERAPLFTVQRKATRPGGGARVRTDQAAPAVPTPVPPTAPLSASRTTIAAGAPSRHRGRKVAIVAAPLAVAATVGSVSFGVLAGGSPASLADRDQGQASETRQVERQQPLSRSNNGRAALALSPKDLSAVAAPLKAEIKQEQKATTRAIDNADTKLWATEDLNLWSSPDEAATQLGELESGEKVLVTGRSEDGREEIVVDGEALWVTSGYLDDEEPVAGLGGACTNGTTTPSGVSPNIAAVHQAVCANFPSISTYGTLRGGGGDHSVGRAVDIMVSGSTGWEVAEFVRAHASELGVSYVIYSQRIWSVQRSGEGWRAMSDRGSVTANHYDHVHVSTY